MTNKEINEVHGKYDYSFQYRGTTFIIDNYPDGFLVSECRMLVKAFDSNLETAKEKAKKSYDKVIKNTIFTP